MEVAALWISVAAVIIMIGWFKSRTEAQKHQTFRTIVEKTGTVDEARLKMLFDVPSASRSNAFGEPAPGGGYRALRVIGALVMFAAAGLLVFSITVFLVPTATGAPPLGNERVIAMGMSGLMFLVGAGLFFSSRFLAKPTTESQRSGGPARE